MKMKFRVEYKEFPNWNETIEAYSWTDLMKYVGCYATKIEVIEGKKKKEKNNGNIT